jgi:hypothetical protein
MTVGALPATVLDITGHGAIKHWVVVSPITVNFGVYDPVIE